VLVAQRPVACWFHSEDLDRSQVLSDQGISTQRGEKCNVAKVEKVVLHLKGTNTVRGYFKEGMVFQYVPDTTSSYQERI
jgi:hypothetical protein